ncbi:hypothetical protein [Streptomyces sp. NPDC004788]
MRERARSRVIVVVLVLVIVLVLVLVLEDHQLSPRDSAGSPEERVVRPRPRAR